MGLALAFVPSALAAQVFHDDFESPTLNTELWNLDVGGGSAVLEAGLLTLSAPGEAQFPYLTPRGNPFPSEGGFLVRVGFRYPDVQLGGNGFGVEHSQRGVGIWQDGCCGGLRVAIGEEYPVYVSEEVDTDPHIFEWRYLDGVYYMWLDDEFVGSSESTFRPSSFYFGHVPAGYCPWTSQEIDFIHIEPLGGVPTMRQSWGRLKAVHR